MLDCGTESGIFEELKLVDKDCILPDGDGFGETAGVLVIPELIFDDTFLMVDGDAGLGDGCLGESCCLGETSGLGLTGLFLGEPMTGL